jgi:pimeloyl-ACP methyl ester carboxylesterase
MLILFAAVAAIGTAVALLASQPGVARASTVQTAVASHGGAKPTIVLVHGAWADSSSWDAVVGRLQSLGYTIDVPPNPLRGVQQDLLYTFAIVAAMFILVSLRTNVATLLALSNLVVTLVLLGAGNYGDHSALVRVGGVTGIILAAQALYLAAAGICEYAYGRTVIWLGPLGHPMTEHRSSRSLPG